MNNQNEIKSKLIGILESLSGNEVEDFSVNIRDIGLDSLKTMDLILNIEDSFELEISDEHLTPENLATPQTILKMILKLTLDPLSTN
jgi:acyl carrier protein